MLEHYYAKEPTTFWWSMQDDALGPWAAGALAIAADAIREVAEGHQAHRRGQNEGRSHPTQGDRSQVQVVPDRRQGDVDIADDIHGIDLGQRAGSQPQRQEQEAECPCTSV